MKFLIQWNSKKEVFKQGRQVYGTGDNYHKVETDVLTERLIAKDKIKVTTGLVEEDIKNSPVLTTEEKEIHLKKLKEVRNRVSKEISEEVLDPTNYYYWKERLTFKITPEVLNNIYDDSNIDHLILKYHILSGSFSSIAPSLEAALRTGRPFYVIEQEEANEKSYQDKIHSKLKAMGALSQLEETGSIDALLYLSWVTLDDTMGYTRNTSKSVLIENLADYIEGNLTKVDKKKCASKFYNNYLKWKNDKESLITEAIVNAAIHFGLIYHEKGKYVTRGKNTILGSDVKESIEILLDGKNVAELKELKKIVEEKLAK